jgi:hypothetical protein
MLFVEEQPAHNGCIEETHMKSSIFTVAAIAAFAGAAHAAEFTWNWTPAQGGFTNNAAGVFESISASFNSTNNRLVWNIVFSNQVTDGYTLALNNGPNPKGHAGELALIYFDYSSGSVEMNAFAYNGVNASNSWQDGNGNAAGNQAADLIHGKNDTSWYTASVVDTADGKRRFNLSIDATTINNHVPLYPGPGGPSEWYGIGFGESLGLWLHTYDSLSTNYFANGALGQWDSGAEGWFDGSNFPAVLVPLPSAAWAGLAGLAVAGVVARRRKAALR